MQRAYCSNTIAVANMAVGPTPNIRLARRSKIHSLRVPIHHTVKLKLNAANVINNIDILIILKYNSSSSLYFFSAISAPKTGRRVSIHANDAPCSAVNMVHVIPNCAASPSGRPLKINNSGSEFADQSMIPCTPIRHCSGNISCCQST